MSLKSVKLLLLAVSCHLTSAASSSCSSQQLLAVPTDCSSFYQCSQGEKIKISCPEGLQFNAEKSYCDWPENVKCKEDFSTDQTSVDTSTPTQATSTLSSSSPVTTSTLKATTSMSSSTEESTKNPTATLQVSTTPITPTTSCKLESTEKLTDEVKKLRLSTCSIPNSEVEKVTPGRDLNPDNVKIFESLVSQENFTNLFPKANPAYTYTNSLKAVAKFPAVCTSAEVCRKILATMFAHFQQETSGLIYLREINKSDYCATWSNWLQAAYPCSSGKQYYGRGAKQLSWNYNYGAFSVAMYGDASVLLENPDLVSDTWLNFASAFWFFVTPQPPKPSMLHLVDGTWKPNSADQAAGLVPGFGATIMAINGAYECGSPGNRQSLNRQKHYKLYCDVFGVDYSLERLDCASMGKFSSSGSANPAIYWTPEQCCRLVKWQTASTALVEGQHKQCQEASNSVWFYLLPFIANYFL